MSDTPVPQKKTHTTAILTAVVLLLSAVEAAAAVWMMLQIPADSKNAVLLGLSAQRLGLVAFLLGGMLFCLGAGAWTLAKKKRAAELLNRWMASAVWKKISFPLLVLFFLALWLAAFTPVYQAGRLQAYFERLQPALVWLFLAGFQLLLVFNLIGKNPSGRIKNNLRLASFLWIFAGFLLVWAFIGLTGIGLKPDNVHWNDAGAPVLGGQILVAVLIGMAVGELDQRLIRKDNKRGKWLDVVLALTIWGAAAAAWIGAPAPHSFFAPGPYPPNYEPYPFSDASSYDLGAQFALIGQGLMNRTYVDKPLYSAFLVLLHLLAGQKYYPVINLQTALIAIFPALIYICGKKLHSRGAGAVAAVLVIFRELDTIGATLWILSSSTRVMMSEPLTMLGIGLFTFFLILWIQSPRREKHWLAAAGGTLGLTTLVRHNPWLLIPAGLLLILVVEWKHWRRWLMGWLVFLLAFTAAISPWMLRNQANNGKPFYFLVPFEGVVMLQRYNVRLEPLPTPTVGPTITPNPARTATATPRPTLTLAAPAVSTPIPAKQGTSFTRLVGRVLDFVPAHFFHNLLVTSSMFPSSLYLEDLEHTVKEPGSIWDINWTGSFDPARAVLLAGYLLLLAAGVGAAWNRWRWAGILPGFVFLSYDMATAVARTSGSRYLQPVDWAALFYLAFGLIQLWNWLRGYFTIGVERQDVVEKVPTAGGKPARPWKCLLVGAIVFCIGGLVPLSEVVFPLRYPAMTTDQLASEVVEKGWAAQIGLDAAELDAFLAQDQAVILRGRALYPRYYGIGEGEPDSVSAYRAQKFPRLVITTVGQDDIMFEVLPLDKQPQYFPNGADVIALGCKGEYNIDLAALILTWPREQVLLRSPRTALTCPLVEPVCDDNRQCY